MPKGFFTQSAAVLFEKPPTLDALGAALAPLGVVRAAEPANNGWMGGPGFILPLRPEVNGYVVVDLQTAAWPDAMGDPKTDAMLFGAWATGGFGPFVYPGNLERAKAMSFGWPEGPQVAARHTAFVRIKTSYVLGAAKDAPVMPADCDPVAELSRVLEIAQALLQAPGALAYFNPNGEVLRDAAGVAEDLRFAQENGLPPLGLWSNVRLFAPESQPDWSVMDTVGMEQVNVADHEACFVRGAYEPGEVDNFLRNATLYVLQNGPTINDGDTMDGPGGIQWQAYASADSLAPRVRPTLRWFPIDDSETPDALQPTQATEG
jgi:hypothetical protein